MNLPIEEEKPMTCRACGCTPEKACQITKNYNCSWCEDVKDAAPLCDNPECLRKEGYTEESIREIWADADEVLATLPEASAEGPGGAAIDDGPVFVDDLGRHCQVTKDDL